MSLHHPNSIFNLLIQHSAIFTNCYKLRIYICVHRISVTNQLLIALHSSTISSICSSYNFYCCQICCSNHKTTMIEQIPSTLQSLDCTFSLILVPSADSTFVLPKFSTRLFLIASWELFWSTRVELFSSRTKPPTQLAISWVEGKSRHLWALQFTTWRQ